MHLTYYKLKYFPKSACNYFMVCDDYDKRYSGKKRKIRSYDIYITPYDLIVSEI